MKVDVGTVEDFLECLAAVDFVFDNTIRVSISSYKSSPNSGVLVVSLKASTVVLVGDESEYILDLNIQTKDYDDASQDFSGTDMVKTAKDRIVSFALSRGWRVLPGIISG